MKKLSVYRVLLTAASALFLANFSAVAKEAPTSLTAAEKKQQAAECRAKKQLKNLVNRQRTKNGWLGDGSVPEGTRVVKDLSYVSKSVSPKQTLDLYIPASNFSVKHKNSSNGWPLVVWIHGGGWRGGDKKGGPYRPLLDSGFAVASINYRLSGEAKWPAQLDDCRSALAYLRAHGKEYGIDAKQVGIWGGSAGGHLVLMLALQGDSKSAPLYEIKAACDWFGPTDLARFRAGGETTTQGQECIPQLFGLEGDALMSACNAASPIACIGHSKHVAPILVVHGREDEIVSIKQSRRFVEQMKAAGFKDIKLDEVTGGHGYPGFGKDVLQNVIAFFKEKMDN